MSFELLRSLYGGRGTNADLVRSEDLARLHIDTALEAFVPTQVAAGLDVVLTGNPGDGKSHTVRLLQTGNRLGDAVVEPDLSARDTQDVVKSWEGAAAARKPYVLCGNEGPLLELLEVARARPSIAERAQELSAQVGRLTVARPDELAPKPRRAVLVDLADRNLVVEANIERALERVCDYSYLPSELGMRATQTSAGRNVLLLAVSPIARKRLARLLAVAGRRRGGHFTFRQLWQAIAFAITGGKAVSTLNVELYQGRVGLGTFPFDNLTKGNGVGPLIEAVRAYGDPAVVTDPDLDERLWSAGIGGLGQPDKEAPLEVPSHIWDEGDHEGALRAHAQLKRYVALTHPEGESLLEKLAGSNDLPSRHSDTKLLSIALEGLRRLYTPPGRDEVLPDWLLSGLPLWLAHSYANLPPVHRPHVAVGCRPADEFSVLRPRRAPWLDGVLGSLPDEAWVLHRPSSAVLRVDADLLSELVRAPHTVGPIDLPERVRRFLSRIAGWEEANPSERAGASAFAILSRPRGEVIADGAIKEVTEGAEYA